MAAKKYVPEFYKWSPLTPQVIERSLVIKRIIWFFLAKNENKCQLANCDTCEFFTLFSKFLSTSTWVSFEEILFHTEVLTQQVELWTW